MKEKPLRRTSKAAREIAQKELTELLPTLEIVAAEPEEKQATMKRSADRARVDKTMAHTQQSVLQKALQEQRAKVDQEIEERQRTMTTREAEMRDLHAQVERFPKELTAATKQAEL
jgi:hypothetical protein